MTKLMAPEKLISEAQLWLGTPYQHQGACRGVGVDCLGLVRGLYTALLPHRLVHVPPYRQWALRGEPEILWQAAETYLVPRALPTVPQGKDFALGDIVLFRLRASLPARHLALISAPDKMIHALAHIGVCEVEFSAHWRRYAVARFAFPAR